MKRLEKGRMHLAEGMAYIDTSAIRRLFDLSAKLEKPINLSIGQPHFATPPAICEALSKAIHDGHTSYTQTQGLLTLREALAEKYQSFNKFTVHPDNILISSGVSSLIQLFFMTCINPQDKILLSEPCFLIYKSLASYFGAKTFYIPENFSEEDIQKQNLTASTGLKFIIICNPSNPSGHIYSEKQLKSLAKCAEKNNAIIISDEIYEAYDYDNNFQSMASIYPQTITLSGFSKSYSMTGLRLAAATGVPEIIKAMTKLQQYTVVCAPSPVQHAGCVALKVDMSKYISNYKENRDYCLKRLSDRLAFTYPAGAFYIFAQLPIKDQVFIERAINEKQLLVVPGSVFSRSNNHIRISYSTDKETLKRGIDALLELL